MPTPRSSAKACSASMMSNCSSLPARSLEARRLPSGPGSPPPVLAAEQAPGEWEVGQDRDPEPLAGGRHLGLDLALEQAVLVLQGHEAGEAPLARDLLGLFEFRRAEVGAADRDDEALADQLVQRRQRLRDRGDPVRPVVLVEVDPVDAEPPQRPLDRPADVLARAARGAGRRRRRSAPCRTWSQ